jgi:hypothetical protein
MIEWPIEILENKYSRWYEQLVTRAQIRTLSSGTYTEKHHIVPRSAGGSDSPDNLARLTAREHFICHWLLVKMTTGKFRAKMVYALRMMRVTPKGQPRYNTKFTSRVYEYYKDEFIKAHTERVTGWKYTDEQKTNMSIAQKKAYKNLDPEFIARRNAAVAEANRTRVYTDEMRTNRSNGLKGIKRSPEYCEMLSKRWKGKKRGPLSAERKKQISEQNSGANNPRSKTWEITAPDGTVYISKGNIKELCKSLPISADSIKVLAHGKKAEIKGWKARFIEVDQ